VHVYVYVLYVECHLQCNHFITWHALSVSEGVVPFDAMYEQANLYPWASTSVGVVSNAWHDDTRFMVVCLITALLTLALTSLLVVHCNLRNSLLLHRSSSYGSVDIRGATPRGSP
jgi:hypothetical protein